MKKRKAKKRIGVTADLTARHRDPIMNEGLHEHTWTFTAWFEGDPFRDLRSQRAALITLLDVYQGTEMPPELWAAEDMCETFARLLCNCIGMSVSRPGYVGEVWL